MAISLMPLLLFAGCRSDSGSRSGGSCGGGCCRGERANDPAVSVAAVRPAVPPVSHGDPVASNTPSQASSVAQARYGGQKTCPVTGDELGSMGSPIPVTVQGQTIYVCCRGCVAKVQRDPDSFLRKVEAERGSRPQGAF